MRIKTRSALGPQVNRIYFFCHHCNDGSKTLNMIFSKSAICCRVIHIEKSDLQSFRKSIRFCY